MIRVTNLQRTSEGSCVSSLSGQLLAEVEIQVKEGGTSINKIFRKYNLVFKRLRKEEGEMLGEREEGGKENKGKGYAHLLS